MSARPLRTVSASCSIDGPIARSIAESRNPKAFSTPAEISQSHDRIHSDLMQRLRECQTALLHLHHARHDLDEQGLNVFATGLVAEALEELDYLGVGGAGGSAFGLDEQRNSPVAGHRAKRGGESRPVGLQHGEAFEIPEDHLAQGQ